MNGDIFKRRLDGTILFLIFIYPVVLLSVRHGVSVCLVALGAFSAGYLYWLRKEDAFEWQSGDAAFAVAMASLLAATVVSQINHSSFELRALDGPSRFLVAVPIYLVLRSVPVAAPNVLEYGFPLGALAGLLTSIAFPSPHWPNATYFLDSIHFGGAMLVLAFLSILAVNWTRKDSPAIALLKLAGFAAGLYGAIQSGARGAWIAFPVLAILWICYQLPGIPRARYGAAAAAVGLIGAGYWLIPQIQHRIEATQSEVASAAGGNLDTNIGVRLQIWKAALQVIGQNPFAGVGPDGFPEALRTVHQQGGISSFALEAGIAEMHNEVLAHGVSLGVLGVLAILSIYLVPLALSLRATRSNDPIQRTAAMMCTFVVASYLIFGLTVETFNFKMFATFYAMTVAILLGIARNTAAAPAPLAAGISGDPPTSA
jgi:O-antigen ligase